MVPDEDYGGEGDGTEPSPVPFSLGGGEEKGTGKWPIDLWQEAASDGRLRSSQNHRGVHF